MKRLSAILPRLAGRRASFKIGVVATLAIAVAANVAVLGNLGVMFGRVVPGATQQHLVEPYIKALEYKSMPATEMGMFRPVYDQFKKEMHGRGQTALYKLVGATLHIGNNRSIRFPYLFVTPSLGAVLGVHVVAGRMLRPGDMQKNAPPVMLLSARSAIAYFGSAKAAVGKTVHLGDASYRIVGVLPANLRFPGGTVRHHFQFGAWVPFPAEPASAASGMDYLTYALVHPGPGMTDSAIHTDLVWAYHDALTHYTPEARTRMKQVRLTLHVASLAQREYGPLITRLQLLELAAVLLFLLVLANLTGLTTADALAQRHEMATRAALGAGVSRLYLSRLRELAGLGLLGWSIGIGLGWLAYGALASTVGQAGPAVPLSLPVLGISLAVVLVVAILLSVVGLRRLLKPSALPADLMMGGHATGGRGLVRTLRALIALQLAASIVLLVIAGHLHANVFSLTHDKLGFDLQQRTFIYVSLPGSEGDQTEAQFDAWVKKARVFDRRMLESLNNLPGVKSAAILSVTPFSGGSDTTNASLQPYGKGSQQDINAQTVSRHITNALGLHVLSGDIARLFGNPAQTVVLDKSAARHFWPDSTTENDVGRHIYLGGKYLQVAAIIASLRMKAYGSVGGTAFRPFATSSHLGGPQNFVVRSTLPQQMLRKQLAHLVKQINPGAQLEHPVSAKALVSSAYAGRARMGQVFGTLAVIALFIAAVGLFALLAYRSLVRLPEFAIRGALGATPWRLLGNVISEAFALWIVGCTLGFPAAYALSLVLDSHLPKLGLPAAWVAVSVALGLGVTALVAAAGPARRAARTNPATNLQA